MPVESQALGMTDALILGGGPAGLVLAILLRRLGHSVIVLERSRYERPRAGETFGGELRSLLSALGLEASLSGVQRTPFRGVRSAWGSEDLLDRSSLFHPFGEGWHVDRAEFDAALAHAARMEGVDVRLETRPASIDRESIDRWLIRTKDRNPLAARYLVDASGRGAPASAPAIPGRRWLQMDRMVAVMARLRAPDSLAWEIAPELLLEAVPEGWWYSAPQPGNTLLITLMTDADLMPAGPRDRLAEAFAAALSRSDFTAQRGRVGKLEGAPSIVRADTGLLLPDHGPGWRAIGDAAMSCDPLAGDGVTRAVRTAANAASDIHRALAGNSPAGHPADLPQAAGDSPGPFTEYLELRSRYYQRESRFSRALFWSRRQPLDWRAAPIFLDPVQRLHCPELPLKREDLAPVEALVPPRALRSLLERLRQPMPAHQALAALRSEAPLENRRLLAGMQDLIARGILQARGSNKNREEISRNPGKAEEIH